MQRLPLLFLLLIGIVALQASFIKDDDWVTIMETKEGVIVESDPESAGTLPKIEESYYPLGPKVYSVVKTQEYTITKLVKNSDLTTLILKDYRAKDSSVDNVSKQKIIFRVFPRVSNK